MTNPQKHATTGAKPITPATGAAWAVFDGCLLLAVWLADWHVSVQVVFTGLFVAAFLLVFSGGIQKGSPRG